MEFHQMRCPTCNADLEIEDGIDMFFCKYCGTKILVDGQSDTAIKAKAEIRKAEIEKELREKEMAFEERQEERQVIKRRNEMIGGALSLLAVALLLLFGSCNISGL